MISTCSANKDKTPTAATIGALNQVNLTTGYNSMNTLAVNNQVVTMSSREIAKLTGKRHDHVCRDIRTILVALLGGKDADYIRNPDLGYKTNQHVTCLQYESNSPNSWEYHISRRYTEILITGYDIKRRTAVIDRLFELESANRNSTPVLPSAKELALLVIQAEEEKERLQLENKELEHQVEEMKPDVDALTRIAKAEGSLCVTDAAKQLQVKPKSLFDLMSHSKWIYRRLGTAWIAYQDKIQQGLLEHKVSVVKSSTGEDKQVSQVRVTAKGLSKLAKLLSVEVMA
ncbi:phage antirepressor KilAC domain-containing protein [Providencia alcalifaciens]|uniref:phage antirepressor KilAC domain-containing protein n=1 Tax=Providencia alcalifaciens TaxID=126385 RepID=UPI00044B137E|nr:phage antirepressor KilAC domain-containing protein [Providencia alcalifaciens]EUD08859.1 antirepressor protein KilAC domain protein [Providencia alcalifaciens R90-1475]